MRRINSYSNLHLKVNEVQEFPSNSLVLVVILAFCLEIFQISKFLKYKNTKPQALPSKAEGHGGKQRSEGTIRGDNITIFLGMLVVVDKVVVVMIMVVMMTVKRRC